MELGIWSHDCSFFSFGGLRAASASDPPSRRLGYGFQRKTGKRPLTGSFDLASLLSNERVYLTKANGWGIEAVSGWTEEYQWVYRRDSGS